MNETNEPKEKNNKKLSFISILSTFNSVVGGIATFLFLQLFVSDEHKKYGYIIFLLILIPWLVNLVLIHGQNKKLKKSLKRIAEINEELKESNKSKEEFLSNVSHEIRTPINAVLGLGEMILVESNEKNIIEYAEGIKNAGNTVLGLINDLLDVQKIEKGKMELVPQNYYLGSVINDLLNMIELRAKGKGLKLETDINADIPKYLYGDDLRIKQIILNILTNAVKYTNKGTVTMKFDYEKADDDNILLCVSVRDTGIGMKPDEIKNLSKPFQRLDEKKNRNIEGTGLGISIVVQLLTQMNSRLEVESTYGKGSVFSFKILQPVVNWEKIGELDGRYHDVVKEEKPEDIKLYAPKGNILVVDDTDINLKVIKGLLKNTGLHIDTAMSGPECLDMVKKTQYHVIFLDHKMPGMDGIVTLHNMQKMDTFNNDTPVVSLTANVGIGARESYLKEGFTDFLAKPVSEINLKKMLLKYLPGDILMEAAPEGDLSEENDTENRENNIMVKNLDMDAGIEACGSKELYKEVALEFAETAEDCSYEIQVYYEQEDYEDYTIKVHALKSTARLVGAQELSKEAAYLEQCGNYRDINEIKAKTEKLLAHYIEVADEIKMLFANKTDKKAEISRSEFKEALVAISGFNEAFDYDKVDEIMAMLSEYSMPEELEGIYEEIKRHVLNVDQDNIRATVKKFLGGKKNG